MIVVLFVPPIQNWICRYKRSKWISKTLNFLSPISRHAANLQWGVHSRPKTNVIVLWGNLSCVSSPVVWPREYFLSGFRKIGLIWTKNNLHLANVIIKFLSIFSESIMNILLTTLFKRVFPCENSWCQIMF